MEVVLELEKADWWRFMSHVEKRCAKNIGNTAFSSMAYWFVIAILFMWMFRDLDSFHWETAITVSVFFLLLLASFILRISKMRKASEPSAKGVFVGKHKFIIGDDGIRSEGVGYTGSHSWTAVKEIERTKDMVLIYLDTTFAFVFPDSKLEDADEFYRFVNERYKAATAL
jgi:hypothetical protein